MRSTTSTSTRPKPQWFALLGMFAVFAPGCSICCQPHLNDYVAFGSRTPRTNMTHGRVGSPFSDPNAGASVSSSDVYYEPQSGEAYGGEVYYEDSNAVVGETEEIYFEGE